MTPTMATLKRVVARLKPPQRINLADWVEQEIYLPETVSALRGKIRLYPFQRGILDAINDPSVSRVTVQKSARIGYTTILNATIANYVINDPSLILVYCPTDDMARSFVVSDLEPTFEASPKLAGVLMADRTKLGAGKDRNKLEMRLFPGGTLKVLATQAARNMRGHNARVLIMDEVDGMTNTPDGDPITVAEVRTSQFADRKIIVGSTPLFLETSRVIATYEKSDKRIYEVPCPHCGDFHEVMWKDIHWPEGEPENAYWACPTCGGVTEHSQKSTIVARGRWRVTAPEVKGHAGFKLNSLISPIPTAHWGELAREFLEKKDDPELLRGFVNLILGEGWRTEGEELDEHELQARALDFGLEKIPVDVLAMTAGIDMQQDRAEVTYVGFAETGEEYVLGHEVIHGQYADDVFWRDIDAAITRSWKHPLGGEISLDAVAVDSSDGSMMRHVYDFCFPRRRRKVLAIKGDEGRRPFIERSKQAIRGGELWIVGVDSIKTSILNRVRNSDIMRFSKDLPPVWFEQFTAERAVIKMYRGQQRKRFERVPGKRNEALDCTVYALAVRNVVTINWPQRRGALSTPAQYAAALAPKPAPIARSDWWQ